MRGHNGRLAYPSVSKESCQVPTSRPKAPHRGRVPNSASGLSFPVVHLAVGTVTKCNLYLAWGQVVVCTKPEWGSRTSE